MKENVVTKQSFVNVIVHIMHFHFKVSFMENYYDERIIKLPTTHENLILASMFSEGRFVLYILSSTARIYAENIDSFQINIIINMHNIWCFHLKFALQKLMTFQTNVLN